MNLPPDQKLQWAQHNGLDVDEDTEDKVIETLLISANIPPPTLRATRGKRWSISYDHSYPHDDLSTFPSMGVEKRSHGMSTRAQSAVSSSSSASSNSMDQRFVKAFCGSENDSSLSLRFACLSESSMDTSRTRASGSPQATSSSQSAVGTKV